MIQIGQEADMPSHPESISIGRITSHFLFGVFLRTFTLRLEVQTGFSAEICINSTPTLLDIVAIALVPLIIFWNLFRCVRAKRFFWQCSCESRYRDETARELYRRVMEDAFNTKRKSRGFFSSGSGTGYVERTMVFKNDDRWCQNVKRFHS